MILNNAICDICGEEKVSVHDLRQAYCTEDINRACDSCLSKLNKQLDKIRGVTGKILVTWMKDFIQNIKST